MQNIRLGSILLCISFSLSLFAQKNIASRGERVRTFFKPEDSIEWVRHFSGRMDDVSDVDITLSASGEKVHGILNYTSSGEQFHLDGKIDGKIIHLAEWDVAKRKSGVIEATLDQTTFSAMWRNHDGSIGGEILAEEIQRESLGISNCGDNKWINRYEASYQKAPIQLLLNHTSKDAIWGYLWVEAEKKQLKVVGTLSPKGDLEATLFDTNSAEGKGNLEGKLESMNTLALKVQLSDGRKHIFSFSLKENMVVNCLSYTDYSSTYDIIYPKSKCASCNQAMENTASTWLSHCKNKVSSAKIESSPNTRNSVRASCWSEINLWDERYISGILMFSSTWDASVQQEAFTFDMSRNKVLDIADLFIDNFNYKSWLEGYAKKETPKLALSGDAEFMKWLNETGFPILTLQKDGLMLGSNFHPIYGRAEIVVPWKATKPYLKKSAVRELVESQAK